MKRAKISELRNRLGRYLDHVRAGGTVIVLERGRPIAEIRPVRLRPARRTQTDAERLDELEREGLIRRGRGPVPKAFIQELLNSPPVAPGARLVEAILEEREESP